MTLRQHAARVLRALVGVPGWLYAVAMIGYLAARLIVGEGWMIVELINSLLPLLTFPAVPLIAFALVLGQKRLAVALVPALALLLIQNVPLFLPNPSTAPEDAPRLRVLTFNLGSRIDTIPLFEAIIRSVNPDVVALQEFLTPTSDGLAAELADEYTYQALHPTGGFAVGTGIFSRYPIVDDQALSGIVLGSQAVRIAWINGQEITIINAHPVPPQLGLNFNTRRRSSEIAMLLEAAATETNPLILLGDFNSTDQSNDYARITARYGDAFRESGTGFGLTFPSLSGYDYPYSLFRWMPPVIRIDYVFYSEHWTAVSARVIGESGRSDHYPVTAELALTGG